MSKEKDFLQAIKELKESPFYTPKGITFYDFGMGKHLLLVQDEEASFDGWLCYKHADGQWVTLRKATEEDIKKIERILVPAQ